MTTNVVKKKWRGINRRPIRGRRRAPRQAPPARRVRSPWRRPGRRVVEDAPDLGRSRHGQSLREASRYSSGVRRVVDLRRAVQPVVHEAVPTARLRGRRDHRRVGGDPRDAILRHAAARPRARTSSRARLEGHVAVEPVPAARRRTAPQCRRRTPGSAGAGRATARACRRARRFREEARRARRPASTRRRSWVATFGTLTENRKSVGDGRGPAGVGRRPVRPVERGVDLDGGEAGGVPLEVLCPPPGTRAAYFGIDQPAMPIRSRDGRAGIIAAPSPSRNRGTLDEDNGHAPRMQMRGQAWSSSSWDAVFQISLRHEALDLDVTLSRSQCGHMLLNTTRPRRSFARRRRRTQAVGEVLAGGSSRQHAGSCPERGDGPRREGRTLSRSGRTPCPAADPSEGLRDLTGRQRPRRPRASPAGRPLDQGLSR